MRRDPEEFGDEELELVQISRKLREAKRVEAALTEAGIEYAVVPDRYRSTSLLFFPRERVGAFFRVRVGQAAAARELLRARGFVVTDEEEGE